MTKNWVTYTHIRYAFEYIITFLFFFFWVIIFFFFFLTRLVQTRETRSGLGGGKKNINNNLCRLIYFIKPVHDVRRNSLRMYATNDVYTYTYMYIIIIYIRSFGNCKYNFFNFFFFNRRRTFIIIFFFHRTIIIEIYIYMYT